MNLRHECETNGCYRAELWDWTPFNDCFGNSGIRISDIDGMVERNGLFLMLDGKRLGTFLKTGQLRLYRNFARRGGTSIVFHGDPTATPQTVAKARIWRPAGDEAENLEIVDPCTLDDLRDIVARWYEWANGLPRQMPQRTPGITVQLEREIHAADPEPTPTGDWPEVARPGDGIPYRRDAA